MSVMTVARAVSRDWASSRHLWIALLAWVLLAAVLATIAGVEPRQIWFLLVFSPIIEETVFRAGLQEALLRHLSLSPLGAIGMTALIFAAAHMAIRGTATDFAVSVPALFIGAVYNRFRQLRQCIGLHSAMNAVWLAWALTIPPAASRL